MYISRSKITDDFKKDTCKLLLKTGNTPSDHYGEAIKVNFGSELTSEDKKAINAVADSLEAEIAAARAWTPPERPTPTDAADQAPFSHSKLKCRHP